MDKKTEALKLAQEWYDSGNENHDDFANMIKQVIALAEQPAQPQEWRGPVDWEEVAADYAKTIAMMKAEQEAAVLAEREACARVCENPDLLMNSTFQGVAEAIRARGEEH